MWEQQLFENARVPIVDGFGALDGDVRWYDDATYDALDARVCLFKLHGSIDWYQFVRRGASWPAIKRHGGRMNALDGAGKPLTPTLRLPLISHWWTKGSMVPARPLCRHSLSVPRGAAAVPTNGGLWLRLGDTGITNQVERWLDQSPGNRLILLHKRPKEIVERSPAMAMSYDSFKERGQIVVKEMWISEAKMSDILSAW